MRTTSMSMNSKGWWWEKLRFSGGLVKNTSALLNFSALAGLVFLGDHCAISLSRALLSSGNPGADGTVWKYPLTADLITLRAGWGRVCRQVRAACCMCPAKCPLPVFPQGMGCWSYMGPSGTNTENSWLQGFITTSWSRMWAWWQSLWTWCW